MKKMEEQLESIKSDTENMISETKKQLSEF